MRLLKISVNTPYLNQHKLTYMVMLISGGYPIHCEIMGVGRSFVVYPIGSPDEFASTSFRGYELCGKVHSL